MLFEAVVLGLGSNEYPALLHFDLPLLDICSDTCLTIYISSKVHRIVSYYKSTWLSHFHLGGTTCTLSALQVFLIDWP